MQPSTLKGFSTAVLFVALAGQAVWANETNPYATIVDRNPFALKPPPPPPAAPENTAPPVPMAKVILTGLLSSFGEPRALFEILEDPGKGGGTPKKPILREGERLGPVEVLAIDVVKNSVRIRNSGVETNVTFEVAAKGPTAGGPGVPGAPPPAFTPPPLTQPVYNTSQNQPASGGPTIISGNSASEGGRGVSLFGGGGAGNAGGSMNTASMPSALGSQSGTYGGFNNAGGTPNIPPRPLRTGTDMAAADSGPPMTRDQAALLMETLRLKGGPPAPPTHLTPIVDGAMQEGNQPPNGFPQLPSRGGPPGLPRR